MVIQHKIGKPCKSKYKFLSVRIDKATHDALRIASEQTGKNISELSRMFIRRGIGLNQ